MAQPEDGIVSTPGEALAEAAENLIGVPFLFHGTDPAAGLDCVGLVAASLVAIGRSPVAPRGYRLRNLSVEQWLISADRSGLARRSGPPQRGDIVLLALPPSQHHVAVATGSHEIVHAHAGLRRVVRQPIDPSMRVAACWCLIPKARG